MQKSAKMVPPNGPEDFVAAVLAHCGDEAVAGPRYARLAAAIEAALNGGALRPGDKVPTEADLAGRLPYGLGTIQKALNLLVAGGLLTRRRRMGTFVASGGRQRLDELPNFTFRRPDGTLVTSVLTSVIGRARIADDGRWSDVLGPAPSGFVAFEERLDWIDEKPFCYVTFHASAERFPDLLERPAGEMRRMLGWGGAARIATLTITAGAAPLPQRARDLLGARGIGLMVEAVATSADGRALYLQTLHVPKDYRLVLTQAR
jgi:DNA-binding GntR family transcriptional regulator